MNDTVNVYDIQGSGYDMAAHELGENWTTPTLEQYGELMQYCTWTWTTQNGVNGYLVTASNNNSIFLPAAGIYINEDISGNGISFYYWTANMPSSTSDQAYQFVGYRDYATSLMPGNRFSGCPVRAVCK